MLLFDFLYPAHLYTPLLHTRVSCGLHTLPLLHLPFAVFWLHPLYHYRVGWFCHTYLPLADTCTALPYFAAARTFTTLLLLDYTTPFTHATPTFRLYAAGSRLLLRTARFFCVRARTLSFACTPRTAWLPLTLPPLRASFCYAALWFYAVSALPLRFPASPLCGSFPCGYLPPGTSLPIHSFGLLRARTCPALDAGWLLPPAAFTLLRGCQFLTSHRFTPQFLPTAP